MRSKDDLDKPNGDNLSKMLHAKQRMYIVKGDITTYKIDAIVNAANKSLLGGSGVDGAIHKAAGPELLEKNKTLGGCETGEAKITPGFKLPAKYIIHTVGPIYKENVKMSPILLSNCYFNSLKLAVANGCKTIAFPAISCGIYGYPVEEAGKIALQTVMEFLMDWPEVKVMFVQFLPEHLKVYQKVMYKM